MIRFEARDGFPGNAVLGEGPLWHRDVLYWVDILEGKVLRSDDTGTRPVKQCSGTVSAVIPRAGNGFVVLGENVLHIVDGDFNDLEVIEVLPQGSATRLSDGTAGPNGELWFGTMCHDMNPGGGLYRLRVGEHTPTLVLQDLGMPNGMAFSPDHKHLYFVDSAAATITSYSYDNDTQEIHSPSLLARVDTNKFGTPDGITVDATGAIWVAHFAGGKVRRLELDGTWSQEILAPASNVTSCVFGGAQLQNLFITSATVELSSDELIEQPGAGGVFTITLPIGGIENLETSI